MGRRKSDGFQFWLLIAAISLSGLMSLVAAFVSWRAVSALNGLDEAVEEARAYRRLGGRVQ